MILYIDIFNHAVHSFLKSAILRSTLLIASLRLSLSALSPRLSSAKHALRRPLSLGLFPFLASIVSYVDNIREPLHNVKQRNFFEF